MPTKKFCVMTIGRTGSTSLMHALEKFDDIALPSRDTDCVDNELLHQDRIKQYMQYYQPKAGEPIEKPSQLINAFYDSHADAAYAGFKSMPNRHPNYAKFITRSDIKFITLIRRDIPSTVSSFLIAMETGSWRRFGGEQSGRWWFDPKLHGRRVLGNLEYVLSAYAMLQQVPNAIRLNYEELCDPVRKHIELNAFFGRTIKIDDPKPPTSGERYVENWDEFVEFIQSGMGKIAAKSQQTFVSQKLGVSRLEPNHKVVFVCGLPRSGTSVFARCLRDHSQISGFKDTGVPENEGQYLQSVFPTGTDHGGPGHFGFEPKAFLNETSLLLNQANSAKLISEWTPYWDLSKSVLLEKSPSNIVRTRFLQAVFPNSHFVMLLRHPLAVAFATQKWSKSSIASLIEHWLICWERFDLDYSHLSHVALIKYENFVTNPQKTLDQLYAELNLSSENVRQEIKLDINTKYFQMWDSFRENMKDTKEKLYFEHILESRLMRFGYSLVNPERIDPYLR